MDPHKARGIKPEGDNRERGDGGAQRCRSRSATAPDTSPVMSERVPRVHLRNRPGMLRDAPSAGTPQHEEENGLTLRSRALMTCAGGVSKGGYPEQVLT